MLFSLLFDSISFTYYLSTHSLIQLQFNFVPTSIHQFVFASSSFQFEQNRFSFWIKTFCLINIFKIEFQLKKYIFSIIVVAASYFQDGELFSKRRVIFKTASYFQVISCTSNRFKTGSYFQVTASYFQDLVCINILTNNSRHHKVFNQFENINFFG